MTVKEAIHKELNVIKDKHFKLLKKANDRKDPFYGRVRLVLFEELTDSYERLLKDISHDC